MPTHQASLAHPTLISLAEPLPPLLLHPPVLPPPPTIRHVTPLTMPIRLHRRRHCRSVCAAAATDPSGCGTHASISLPAGTCAATAGAEAAILLGPALALFNLWHLKQLPQKLLWLYPPNSRIRLNDKRLCVTILLHLILSEWINALLSIKVNIGLRLLRITLSNQTLPLVSTMNLGQISWTVPRWDMYREAITLALSFKSQHLKTEKKSVSCPVFTVVRKSVCKMWLKTKSAATSCPVPSTILKETKTANYSIQTLQT